MERRPLAISSRSLLRLRDLYLRLPSRDKSLRRPLSPGLASRRRRRVFRSRVHSRDRERVSLPDEYDETERSDEEAVYRLFLWPLSCRDGDRDGDRLVDTVDTELMECEDSDRARFGGKPWPPSESNSSWSLLRPRSSSRLANNSSARPFLCKGSAKHSGTKKKKKKKS